MKRLVSILIVSCLALLALSLAQETVFGIPIKPVSVELDDADFDYYDKEEAYIHLSREGNVVTVMIDDNASPDGLLIEFDEVEAPDDDEVKEETLAYHREPLRAHVGLDASFQGVEMTFKDTFLFDVIEHFDGLLTEMNFAPVKEHSTGNTYVYDCGCNIDPGFHLRVVFTWLSGDTFVSIKSS